MNGKQKAYVVNQTQLPTVSESELSKLESDVAAKQATLDRQSKNLAASEAALRKLASTPKTDEILSEIKFLNGNVGDLASMRENLSSLAAAGAEEPLDKKELDNMLAKKEGALKVTDIVLLKMILNHAEFFYHLAGVAPAQAPLLGRGRQHHGEL